MFYAQGSGLVNMTLLHTFYMAAQNAIKCPFTEYMNYGKERIDIHCQAI